MTIDRNKTTLVLGAYGRIGQQLVAQMDAEGYNLLFPSHNECDLLNEYSYREYFHRERPRYVINLLGRTTNINLCKHYPASICRDTVTMNMNVLEMCKEYEVEKLINIVSSCAYDGETPLLREEDFWKGSPHESIRAHGLAKRMVYFLGQSYSKQFHMNVVTLALNTLYGGCTWDKPTSLKFLDSLIVKVVDAKIQKFRTVYLWGTGMPRREVLYSRDAAEGVLRAFENYNSSELLNLGTGVDYSVREYAEMIASIVKWKGEFMYEKDKPDGQMQKLFRVEKMRTELEWSPPTSLEEGISETIEDYKLFEKTLERKSYRLE